MKQLAQRTPSLFEAPRPSTYSEGGMGKYWETRGGMGKSGVLEHKSDNISETLKYRGNVTIGAYRKSLTLCQMVHTGPFTASASPRLGFVTPKTSIAIISGTGKATNFKFCTHIQRIDRNKSPLKFRENYPWVYSGTVKNFRAPYRAHRAVIFAIAQLSCCLAHFLSIFDLYKALMFCR